MIALDDDTGVRIAHVCSVEWTTRRTVRVTLLNGKEFESDPDYAQAVWAQLFESREP